MAVVDVRQDLLEKVKILIHDQDDFTEEELNTILEEHCEHVEWYRLTPTSRQRPGGSYYGVYLSKPYSQWGTFEVFDANEEPVALQNHDAYNGVFYVDNVPPPLYITGDIYDIYSMAAELLEIKANRLPIKFDVSADGAEYKYSQVFRELMAMAGSYRMNARVKSVEINGAPWGK